MYSKNPNKLKMLTLLGPALIFFSVCACSLGVQRTEAIQCQGPVPSGSAWKVVDGKCTIVKTACPNGGDPNNNCSMTSGHSGESGGENKSATTADEEAPDKTTSADAGKACSGGRFLTFPSWFNGLGVVDANGQCTPRITGLSDIWVIVLNILSIALQLVGVITVGFVIYGGFTYLTSAGNPDRASKGRDILLKAIVGLVVAVASAAVVGMVATRIGAK